VSIAEKQLFVSVDNAQDGHREQVHYKDLIYSVIKARGTEMNLTVGDIYFIYPYTNQSLALLSGIESAFYSKSFLCAAVLTRCLLDCVLSLSYALHVDRYDSQAFVDEYRKSGELTKPNPKGKRFRLTGKDLVNAFKECTGFDVSNSYTQLSKMVHPTIHHLHASIKELPESDADFEFGFVGEKTIYPQHLYDELKTIIDLCIIRIAIIWDALSPNPRFAGFRPNNLPVVMRMQ